MAEDNKGKDDKAKKEQTDGTDGGDGGQAADQGQDQAPEGAAAQDPSQDPTQGLNQGLNPGLNPGMGAGAGQQGQGPVGGQDAGVVGGTDQAANQPQAGLVAQYIKDLSFENPNAPNTFQAMRDKQPNIQVNVDVGARQAGEQMYEVDLKISASSKTDETTVFVAELIFSGLFGLRNIPQEALQPFLLVQAPHLLFPFARRIIADAVRDGGFPPLMLEPIDFASLYRQQLAQQQQQAGGPAPDAQGGGMGNIGGLSGQGGVGGDPSSVN